MTEKTNIVSFLKLACDFSARVAVLKDLNFKIDQLPNAFVRVQEDILEISRSFRENIVPV